MVSWDHTSRSKHKRKMRYVYIQKYRIYKHDMFSHLFVDVSMHLCMCKKIYTYIDAFVYLLVYLLIYLYDIKIYMVLGYVIVMMHFWCMCILHTCLYIYILCKKLVIISSPHLQHQQLFTTDSLLALHLIEQLKMNSSFHRPSTTFLGSTRSLGKILWANLGSKYLGMSHGFSSNKHFGNGWIWWI